MKRLIPCLILLLALFTGSCNKIEKNDIVKSVEMDIPIDKKLKKNMIAYVYRYGDYPYHKAMDNAEIIPYDLDSIRARFQQPKAFKDPRAAEHNKQVFDSVERMSKNFNILYYMHYLYWAKTLDDLDDWEAKPAVVLIGEDNEVIAIVDYLP